MARGSGFLNEIGAIADKDPSCDAEVTEDDIYKVKFSRNSEMSHTSCEVILLKLGKGEAGAAIYSEVPPS